MSSYALDIESAVFATQLIKSLERYPDVFTVNNNILSESALGSLSAGIAVSGEKPGLAEAIVALLNSFGPLAALAPPPVSTGISTGSHEPVDAIIFVAVKPLPRE